MSEVADPVPRTISSFMAANCPKNVAPRPRRN